MIRRSPSRAAPSWQLRSPSTRKLTRVFSMIMSHTSCTSRPLWTMRHRRDPQGVFPGVRGAGVVTRHPASADVGVVALGHRPEPVDALMEDGPDDHDVGRVVVAPVGVVEDPGVTLVHVFGGSLGDGLHGVGRGSADDRDVVRLSHKPSVSIEDGGDEVSGLREDRRARGSQHRLAHLLGDGVESVGDHRDLDGIDGHCRGHWWASCADAVGRVAMRWARRRM